jgi:hypothetical protein
MKPKSSTLEGIDTENDVRSMDIGSENILHSIIFCGDIVGEVETTLESHAPMLYNLKKNRNGKMSTIFFNFFLINSFFGCHVYF